MNWQFRWTKLQQASAKRQGKTIFGLAIGENPSGRAEIVGFLDNDTVWRLLNFTMALYKGKTPQEAFDYVGWPDGLRRVGESEIEMLARAAGGDDHA